MYFLAAPSATCGTIQKSKREAEKQPEIKEVKAGKLKVLSNFLASLNIRHAISEPVTPADQMAENSAAENDLPKYEDEKLNENALADNPEAELLAARNPDLFEHKRISEGVNASPGSYCWMLLYTFLKVSMRYHICMLFQQVNSRSQCS